MGSRSVASGAAAAALALALSSGNFDMAPPRALAAPPAVVQQIQQGPTTMLADDLTDEQRQFMAQRKTMATKYESQTEGTFKSAEQVKDKKSIYTAIVGGLIVVAFVAPMVQFWFYTGGDWVAPLPRASCRSRSSPLARSLRALHAMLTI